MKAMKVKPMARAAYVATDNQPSQFEQIVDLRISDLPCDRPRLEIDYLLEL